MSDGRRIVEPLDCKASFQKRHEKSAAPAQGFQNRLSLPGIGQIKLQLLPGSLCMQVFIQFRAQNAVIVSFDLPLAVLHRAASPSGAPIVIMAQNGGRGPEKRPVPPPRGVQPPDPGVQKSSRRAAASCSTSSSVLPGQKLTRIAPSTTGPGSPMASSTWLRCPLEQAEPADT